MEKPLLYIPLLSLGKVSDVVNRPRTLFLLVFFVLALVPLQKTFATDSTWTGAADTDWSNAGNWNNGIVPSGRGDRAIFNGPTAATAFFFGDVTIGTIQFGPDLLPPGGGGNSFEFGRLPAPPTNFILNGDGIQNLNLNNPNPVFFIRNGSTVTLKNNASAGTGGRDSFEFEVSENSQLIFNNTTSAGNNIAFHAHNTSEIIFNGNASAGESTVFQINDASQLIFNGNASVGNNSLFSPRDTPKIIFNDTTSAGDRRIHLRDASALIFNQTADSTFSGTVTGSGSVTQSGTHRLTFSGNNSYIPFANEKALLIKELTEERVVF